MRRRYSMAFGRESHPSDFSRKRMELGTRDFGFVKEQFLEYWPEWRDDWEVRDAIERVAIWRNALGHANVQPFREFLLYTPADSAWKRIQRYTRCHRCFKYQVECDALMTTLLNLAQWLSERRTSRPFIWTYARLMSRVSIQQRCPWKSRIRGSVGRPKLGVT